MLTYKDIQDKSDFAGINDLYDVKIPQDLLASLRPGIETIARSEDLIVKKTAWTQVLSINIKNSPLPETDNMEFIALAALIQAGYYEDTCKTASAMFKLKYKTYYTAANQEIKTAQSPTKIAKGKKIISTPKIRELPSVLEAEASASGTSTPAVSPDTQVAEALSFMKIRDPQSTSPTKPHLFLSDQEDEPMNILPLEGDAPAYSSEGSLSPTQATPLDSALGVKRIFGLIDNNKLEIEYDRIISTYPHIRMLDVLPNQASDIQEEFKRVIYLSLHKPYNLQFSSLVQDVESFNTFFNSYTMKDFDPRSSSISFFFNLIAYLSQRIGYQSCIDQIGSGSLPNLQHLMYMQEACLKKMDKLTEEMVAYRNVVRVQTTDQSWTPHFEMLKTKLDSLETGMQTMLKNRAQLTSGVISNAAVSGYNTIPSSTPRLSSSATSLGDVTPTPQQSTSIIPQTVVPPLPQIAPNLTGLPLNLADTTKPLTLNPQIAPGFNPSATLW